MQNRMKATMRISDVYHLLLGVNTLVTGAKAFPRVKESCA